jgi:MerR family transcriptional regulator, thiopeptide resistance regulator
MKPGHYQVKEVAELSGVSVRTLHHYDRIGLLVPSGRSSAGYRLYSEDDLLRLQQVLVQRELGLSLEAIRKLLDDPAFDHRAALLEQRRLLLERAQQTDQMIRTLDRALSLLDKDPAAEGEDTMSKMQDLFDGFDPKAYEQEAKERWGHTDAYKESQRRANSYSKEDWERFRAENGAITDALVSALNAGKKPDEPEVMDLAEQARLIIDRWFYPCSDEMHTRLADMYEADPRFAANIDKAAAGLTPFLSAAIRANAARSNS